VGPRGTAPTSWCVTLKTAPAIIQPDDRRVRGSNGKLGRAAGVAESRNNRFENRCAPDQNGCRPEIEEVLDPDSRPGFAARIEDLSRSLVRPSRSWSERIGFESVLLRLHRATCAFPLAFDFPRLLRSFGSGMIVRAAVLSATTSSFGAVLAGQLL